MPSSSRPHLDSVLPDGLTLAERRLHADCGARAVSDIYRWLTDDPRIATQQFNSHTVNNAARAFSSGGRPTLSRTSMRPSNEMFRCPAHVIGLWVARQTVAPSS